MKFVLAVLLAAAIVANGQPLGVPGPPCDASGLALKEPCTDKSQCCSGFCPKSKGKRARVCKCRATSKRCEVNSNCCSNLCIKLQFVPPGTPETGFGKCAPECDYETQYLDERELKCIDRGDYDYEYSGPPPDVPLGPPSDRDGELKLAAKKIGKGWTSGRLEVFYNPVFGTICDDGFGIDEADIACKELGFSGGGLTNAGDRPEVSDTRPIWLDDVSCIGNETMLADCNHSPVGDDNCSHSEDVYVSCTKAMGSSGAFRLTNLTKVPEYGLTLAEVQVQKYGKWGTVCSARSDGVDEATAAVACGMAGLPKVGAIAYKSQGSSQLPVLFSQDLACSGSEASLADCPAEIPDSDDYVADYCTHYDDINVSCRTGGAGPTGKVRLANAQKVGPLPGTYARAELNQGGSWGAVCGAPEKFGHDEANVVCKAGGFAAGMTPGRAYISAENGDSADYDYTPGDFADFSVPPYVPVVLTDGVDCSGSENSITACPVRPPLPPDDNDNDYDSYYETCSNTNPAVVLCASAFQKSKQGKVSLVDTVKNVNGFAIAGRLSIYYNGFDGSVGVTGFDDLDAKVACVELGYKDGAYAGTELSGPAGTYIAVADLKCTGTEKKLFTCERGEVQRFPRFDGVSVACSSGQVPPGLVRLTKVAKGTSASVGNLEVSGSGGWKIPCADSWSNGEAAVACRVAGFKGGLALRDFNPKADSPKLALVPKALLDIECEGTEASFADCPPYTPDYGDAVIEACYSRRPAPAVCSKVMASDCPKYNAEAGKANALRLVDGVGGPCADLWAGRLEIYHDGEWGTICNDKFNDDDKGASVACKQLGFEFGYHADMGLNGPRDSTIWLDAVQCKGNEKSLVKCKLPYDWGVEDCFHSEDVNIICSQFAIEKLDLNSDYDLYDKYPEDYYAEGPGPASGPEFGPGPS